VIFKIIAHGYDQKYNMISSDALAVHTRPILANILHYLLSTPNIIPAHISTRCSVIKARCVIAILIRQLIGQLM